MTTYRYLTNDILETFKQSEQTSEITFSQVSFWIAVLSNKMRFGSLMSYRTGAYLDVFKGVPVETVAITVNPNEIAGRKFFRLPKMIYDMPNDSGIEFIQYDLEGSRALERGSFQRTTFAEIRRLYKGNGYEIPSPCEPFWYRVHENVYLLGVDDVPIKNVEVALYTSIDTRVNLLGLDALIDLSDEMIIDIKTEILKIGRFALATLRDRANDGADTTNQQTAQASGQ